MFTKEFITRLKLQI